jgi:integrase
MQRKQSGYIFASYSGSGEDRHVVSYNIRYYVTELVDGKPTRKQKSERLCAPCADDPQRKLQCNKRGKCEPDQLREKKPAWCRTVQELADAVMKRVNGQSSTVLDTDTSIVDFWEHTYLPHLQSEVKPSTLNGYKKVWKTHLSGEFAGKTLKAYRTGMGTAFLTKLAKNGNNGEKPLGSHAIAHVKSLARAMFGYAAALELIESNPWHDAKSLAKPKKGNGTHAYTLEQAEAIVNALIDDPAARLVFALACFMGLRPGEIEALKWSDISDGWLHVRRASWRGIVGSTKTEESVASVPLIEPVKSMVKAWHEKSDSPSDGWMFPSNRADKPMIIHGLIKRDIIPVVEKKRIEWKGLYSGRRACATLLTQLTGNATAAQYVLRHRNLATTTAFYVKPTRDAAVDGLKLVEAELAKRKALIAGAVKGQ